MKASAPVALVSSESKKIERVKFKILHIYNNLNRNKDKSLPENQDHIYFKIIEINNNSAKQLGLISIHLKIRNRFLESPFRIRDHSANGGNKNNLRRSRSS